LYKFFVGVCVLRAKSLHRPQLIAYGAYDWLVTERSVSLLLMLT
jgi:hypothetical protein